MRESKKVIVTDITQTPEFVSIFSTVVFVAIIIYLGVGKLDEIPSNGFQIYGKTYYFYLFGIAALLFNLTIFCYLMTVRIFNR